MVFDAEFKKAISLLSSNDKDKLILRLLKRDLNLANKLYFELVSSDSVQQRRASVEHQVSCLVDQATANYYSPGCLLMELRYISGMITEHVKITKDKYGEVSLSLFMLNEMMKSNHDELVKATLAKAYTFNIYVIARAFKILTLIKALHEDFHVEFEDKLKALGGYLAGNPCLMKMAINNGFDINWLSSAQIPDDIAQIHKSVRSAGFLK